MSIVAPQTPIEFDDTVSIESSNAQRYNGIIVAIVASIFLWGGIGAGFWGIVSLFS